MSRNKILCLSDTDEQVRENASLYSGDKGGVQKTNVKVYSHETGELVFEGSNKVLVAGSAFTAAKHFNITPSIWTPSYNQVLKLDNTVDEPYDGEGIRPDEKIQLFCVGIGGCGIEQSQVYPVDYTKWISPEELVPFRYQNEDNDLGASMRELYFGRQTLANGFIAYNFKAFDSKPVFKQQYTDGTPIDENIYISERTDDVESFVEIKMSVTKDDCRDFFKETTGINTAQISSISLLEAWVKEIDGYKYYQDVKPITRYNFSNESLIDLTKGIDIIYDIYY